MRGKKARYRRLLPPARASLAARTLRIRLRRAAACFGEPAWRDARAVVSLLVPVNGAALERGAVRPGGLVASGPAGGAGQGVGSSP